MDQMLTYSETITMLFLLAILVAIYGVYKEMHNVTEEIIRRKEQRKNKE
jgi:hypothetical protein